MFMRRITFTVVIALAVSATRPAFSQEFDLSWYTVDGGGGASVGDGFELAGTIGQPDAGTMTGGGFELVGGFWPGAQPTSPPCPGDLDGDGVIGLSDLAVTLANFGTASGALPEDGDLNGDGDVDLEDLAQMLALFGTVCE